MKDPREVVLEFGLPPYPLKAGRRSGASAQPGARPKPAWRREIHRRMLSEKVAGRVAIFGTSERLDLEIEVILPGRLVNLVDLDNLQKDIFDALQGRLGRATEGGPKRHKRLVPNDHQIYRLTMVKREGDAGSEGGTVKVRRFVGTSS